MILARHAQAMWWAGRYLERAETTARCFVIEASSIMYLMPDAAREKWEGLVRALGLEKQFEAVGGVANRSDVASFLLADADNPGSVVSSVILARENLRAVRDRLPIELWEEANGLHLQLQALISDDSEDSDDEVRYEPHEVFLMVRRACLALGGVLSDSMRRDEGHAFMVIGRMLERAVFTVGLLRSHMADPRRGGLGWSPNDPRGGLDAARLLRLTNSLEAFRRAHGHSRDSSQAVIVYLLTSLETPRSVLSCATTVAELLRGMAASAPALDGEWRQAGLLCARLELGDVNAELVADPMSMLGGIGAALAALAEGVRSRVMRPVGIPSLRSQYVTPGRSLPASELSS